MELKVKMLKGECRYGGSVGDALHNPFTEDSIYDYDMSYGTTIEAIPYFRRTK